MPIEELFHALADWCGDSSGAPGEPGGPGPFSAAPPLGATATDAPSDQDNPDDSTAEDDPSGSPRDPYRKDPTLKDLAETGRRALEELFDIGTEVVDLKTKPYDQLTEDEKIATGREDPAATDPGEALLKKGIEEAMDHAPPGAADALEYGLETVENSSKALTEGVVSVHKYGVRRQKILDSLSDSDGGVE